MVEASLKLAATNGKLNDQDALKKYLGEYPVEAHLRTKVGYFNKVLFASGHTLRWAKMNERLAIEPMVVHFNWARAENKKGLMLQYNMWFVGNEFTAAS
jgi:hypothetical protein